MREVPRDREPVERASVVQERAVRSPSTPTPSIQQNHTTFDPRTSPGAYVRLITAIDLIDDTVQVVRRIAMDLRPTLLDGVGLTAAVTVRLATSATHLTRSVPDHGRGIIEHELGRGSRSA